MQKKFDVHQAITDRIVAQIEAGASSDDFIMPWHRSTAPLHRPQNVASKRRYNGINVVSLWMTAEANGYASNTWGTFKQWLDKGTPVKKGEKGTLVIFYKELEVAPRADDPEDDGRRLMARASWVFNAAQVDGYIEPAPAPDLGPIARIEAAEAFIRASGATIKHEGQSAFYRPSTDEITMPDDKLFRDTKTSTRTEGYYSTLFHELTHWTGAEKRLNRVKGSRFGDPKYAFEELVAELGAAFLCGAMGITNEPRPDHAQYIHNWLAVLKHDKKAIFSAASLASKACDYLEGLAADQPVIVAEAVKAPGVPVPPRPAQTSFVSEPTTTQIIAAKASRARPAPAPLDFGLFGSSHLQADLCDLAKA